MKYCTQTFTSFAGDEIINILRITDDGTVTVLGLGKNDPEYLAWVAAGNTAQEWQPEDVD